MLQEARHACASAGVAWVGDLAPEHKLAAAWQPLLAWLDGLALALALDPADGAALQAAALADLDARAGGEGSLGFSATRRVGSGDSIHGARAGRSELQRRLLGLEVRAAAEGRVLEVSIEAAFPPLLPATAERAQGALKRLPCQQQLLARSSAPVVIRLSHTQPTIASHAH